MHEGEPLVVEQKSLRNVFAASMIYSDHYLTIGASKHSTK
jgi:hypothetical protein